MFLVRHGVEVAPDSPSLCCMLRQISAKTEIPKLFRLPSSSYDEESDQIGCSGDDNSFTSCFGQLLILQR